MTWPISARKPWRKSLTGWSRNTWHERGRRAQHERTKLNGAGSAKKTGARGARQTLTEGNYSSKTIGRLPVGSGIEAFALFIRGDTQTHRPVGDLVGNGRNHSPPDDPDSP